MAVRPCRLERVAPETTWVPSPHCASRVPCIAPALRFAATLQFCSRRLPRRPGSGTTPPNTSQHRPEATVSPCGTRWTVEKTVPRNIAGSTASMLMRTACRPPPRRRECGTTCSNPIPPCRDWSGQLNSSPNKTLPPNVPAAKPGLTTASVPSAACCTTVELRIRSSVVEDSTAECLAHCRMNPIPLFAGWHNLDRRQDCGRATLPTQTCRTPHTCK